MNMYRKKPWWKWVFENSTNYADTKDTIEYVANLDKWVINKFGYKYDD